MENQKSNAKMYVAFFAVSIILFGIVPFSLVKNVNFAKFFIIFNKIMYK